MKKTFLPTVKMIAEARNTSKGHKLWLEILIFIAVFFVGQSIVAVPVTIASMLAVFLSPEFALMMEQAMAGATVDAMKLTESLMSSMPDWVMLVQLFSTALMTAVVILFCRFIEKRSLFTMGLRRKHFFREYGIGALVGILLISASVVVCMLTGSLSLSPNTFSFGDGIVWLLFLVGFLIQGMSEEVVCRGYMMVSVSRRNSLVLAVITNSVVFSLLHLFNPGFGIIPLINIVLVGVLLSVYVLKRGDLWGACAIHSLWNFFQGNVYGISVSGTDISTTPLVSVMNPDHAILNGGSFGLEGGLAVTAVLALATVFIIFVLPTKKEEIAA